MSLHVSKKCRNKLTSHSVFFQNVFFVCFNFLFARQTRCLDFYSHKIFNADAFFEMQHLQFLTCYSVSLAPFIRKVVSFFKTVFFLHREPGDNQQHQLAGTIGIPMCQAMLEYNQGNYGQTVELLYPLRYRMVDIGGSDAQVSLKEFINC